MTNSIYHYIYLIQEREFLKTNENVFKIGKTKQDNLKRLSQYPKGSILLLHIMCSDCDTTETKLIDLFKQKYKQRTDIGTEYFEGSLPSMMNDICHNILSSDSPSITQTHVNDSVDTDDKLQKIISQISYHKNIIGENSNYYNTFCDNGMYVYQTSDRGNYLHMLENDDLVGMYKIITRMYKDNKTYRSKHWNDNSREYLYKRYTNDIINQINILLPLIQERDKITGNKTCKKVNLFHTIS